MAFFVAEAKTFPNSILYKRGEREERDCNPCKSKGVGRVSSHSLGRRGKGRERRPTTIMLILSPGEAERDSIFFQSHKREEGKKGERRKKMNPLKASARGARMFTLFSIICERRKRKREGRWGGFCAAARERGGKGWNPGQLCDRMTRRGKKRKKEKPFRSRVGVKGEKSGLGPCL